MFPAGEAVRRITVAKGTSDLAALAQALGPASVNWSAASMPRWDSRPSYFVASGVLATSSVCLGSKAATGWRRPLHADTMTRLTSFVTARVFPVTRLRFLLGEGAELARHFYLRFGVSHSYNTAGRGSMKGGQSTRRLRKKPTYR